MAKLWCFVLGLALLQCPLGTMADSDENSSSMDSSSDEEALEGAVDPFPPMDEVYQMAEYCDPTVCLPPNCRCASTVLTEDIPVEQIPQVICNVHFVSY